MLPPSGGETSDVPLSAIGGEADDLMIMVENGWFLTFPVAILGSCRSRKGVALDTWYVTVGDVIEMTMTLWASLEYVMRLLHCKPCVSERSFGVL